MYLKYLKLYSDAYFENQKTSFHFPRKILIEGLRKLSFSLNVYQIKMQENRNILPSLIKYTVKVTFMVSLGAENCNTKPRIMFNGRKLIPGILT